MKNILILSLASFVLLPSAFAEKSAKGLSKEELAAKIEAYKAQALAEGSSSSDDSKKCQAIAEEVCGTGESLSECMKSQRRSFPSYCVSEVSDAPSIESVQTQLSSASASSSSCQVKMQEACKELVPSAKVADGQKFDIEAYKVQLTKYHDCMSDAATSQCTSFFEDASSSKGKNIQVIGN